MRDRIVAIGLLTHRDLGLLGPAFDRAFPLTDARDFDGLIKAIDQADEKLRAARSQRPVGPEPVDG